MSQLKVNSGDWIVVCDGTKALILENVGDRAYPDLRVEPHVGHIQLDRHRAPRGDDTQRRLQPPVAERRLCYNKEIRRPAGRSLPGKAVGLACRGTGERKVRAPQDTVVGNAHRPQG